MPTVAFFLSPWGSLPPRPFALGAIAVSIAASLGYLLLYPALSTRAGPAPFVLVQALATWSWFCLHGKRLRDAGEGTSAAAGIASLYALAAVLFLLLFTVIADLLPQQSVNAAGADLAGSLAVPQPLEFLGRIAELGLFGYILIASLALVLLPILIELVFSFYAFSRPTRARVGETPA